MNLIRTKTMLLATHAQASASYLSLQHGEGLCVAPWHDLVPVAKSDLEPAYCHHLVLGELERVRVEIAANGVHRRRNILQRV